MDLKPVRPGEARFLVTGRETTDVRQKATPKDPRVKPGTTRSSGAGNLFSDFLPVFKKEIRQSSLQLEVGKRCSMVLVVAFKGTSGGRTSLHGPKVAVS